MSASGPARSERPKLRVAFLGLGIMGSRMAANVAAAGHDLTVWNRTSARAHEFAAAHPARVASAPSAAAQGAEVIVSMVVDGPQVREVLLGPDGAAAGATAGAVCVDCSTIGPDWARRIGAELDGHGLAMLDAPVTGSAPKAADGTLTIMVGGEAEHFARAEPVLQAMGELIVTAGPLGRGQAIKVLNNAVAAMNATTVAQALALGQAAGIDLDALTTVMGAGSGASAMLALKAGPMREREYAPLFKLDHMLKDVGLCLEQARAAGAPFPLGALAGDVLSAASGRGLGEQDFAALAEVILPPQQKTEK